MLKNLCLDYFDKFSNKDLTRLIGMFADNKTIKLKDWNIDKVGISEVKSAYKEIFDGVDIIMIIPLSMYQEDNVVCCKIKIIINKNEILNVMDVITFNSYGFIQSIEAYKC